MKDLLDSGRKIRSLNSNFVLKINMLKYNGFVGFLLFVYLSSFASIPQSI